MCKMSARLYSRRREFPKELNMDAAEPKPENSSTLFRNLILVTSYLLVMALIAIGYK
jgi:hypothetical protein